MIVDDEEHIRETAAAALESFGYKTVTASNGVEGLASFAENLESVSVVLTDISMPKMDGPSMIKTLNKLSPGIPIVAMSGLMSAEQKAAIESQGVRLNITKPFTAQTLLTTIAQALKSK